MSSTETAEKLLTKLSGFLISCAMPAVSWPSEASFSVWTRRSCAVRKSSSEASTFWNKRAFSIATADCAAKVLIKSTVFCGKAPGVRRRTTSMPTTSSPRSSGATNRARKPARRMISLMSRGASSLKSATWIGSRLREGLSDVRFVKADALLRQRVNQLLIHAVGGAQMKFALQLIEDIDRAGLGAGELHRLGDDGGEHGFEIECRVHRLRHFAERAQFTRPSGQVHRCAGAIRPTVERSRSRSTAWSAKVSTSAICLSVKGRTS